MNGEKLAAVKENLKQAEQDIKEADDIAKRLRAAGRPDTSLENRVLEKKRDLDRFKRAFS
jgi:hypothetical protein